MSDIELTKAGIIVARALSSYSRKLSLASSDEDKQKFQGYIDGYNTLKELVKGASEAAKEPEREDVYSRFLKGLSEDAAALVLYFNQKCRIPKTDYYFPDPSAVWRIIGYSLEAFGDVPIDDILAARRAIYVKIVRENAGTIKHCWTVPLDRIEVID